MTYVRNHTPCLKYPFRIDSVPLRIITMSYIQKMFIKLYRVQQSKHKQIPIANSIGKIKQYQKPSKTTTYYIVGSLHIQKFDFFANLSFLTLQLIYVCFIYLSQELDFRIMGGTDSIIEALKQGIYSIQPILADINRELLGLAYTPGVGTICLDIQKDARKADTMTMRGRAVAIVSDGSMLNSQGKSFMPVMDWLIVQIKYYSGLDAFPFVIRKGTDLVGLLRDLSTTFSAVVYLDDHSIATIPQNILFVRQQVVSFITNSSITDAKAISAVLSYSFSNAIKGQPTVEELTKAVQSPIIKRNQQFKPFVKSGQDLDTNSRQFHTQYQGKIKIVINNQDFHKLQQIFTEESLRKIVKMDKVQSKTSKLAAIVTDRTAILGLGNIGPTAGLPVMEGKSLLFKLLGGVQVFPVCVYPRKTSEELVEAIANTIGYLMAVNLEDISAPHCFDVENGLKKLKLLPVFHDDQHGTAIVVLAALINASKVAGKDIIECKIVVNGAGAAGLTIARILVSFGVKNVIVCDTKGAIFKGRTQNMNAAKQLAAEVTNPHKETGKLEETIQKADIFIGLSIAGALKGEMIHKMNEKPIIFALANPVPEILPDEAKSNGAFIYGSGRSDFQNQINNSLVFPGIFKGIKDHHIKEITQDMKIKAAVALSKCLDRQPTVDYVIPASLDKKLAVVIANEIGK